MMGFFINAIYKMIYLYSCIEIYVGDKYEKFEKTEFAKKILRVSSYFFPEYTPSKQFLFVKDGKQIMVFNEVNSEKLFCEIENYDFILCNDYRKIKNKWINRKIIYDNFQEIVERKTSSESILSFVVYYKEHIIDILLETNTYTYMIVGNKINKKFVFYLLKNMGIDCSEDFEYNIQIITGNVNVLKMNSSQELIINESSLSIV